jgi:hypothetical protein
MNYFDGRGQNAQLRVAWGDLEQATPAAQWGIISSKHPHPSYEPPHQKIYLFKTSAPALRLSVHRVIFDVGEAFLRAAF